MYELKRMAVKRVLPSTMRNSAYDNQIISIMSQEIDARQTMPQPPSDMTVRPDNGGMCALSVVFVIVGIVAIIVGGLVGLATYETYDKYGYGIVMERSYATLWLCIFCGIIVGILNFAMAVIVDACQKYRKAHKG